MIQQTRRTRETVEQQFQLLDDEGVRVSGGGYGGKSGQHVIFAGSLEEQQMLGSVRRQQDSTSSAAGILQQPADQGNAQYGQRREELHSMDPQRVVRRKAEVKEEVLQEVKRERAARKLRKRQRDGRESLLKALKAREKELVVAEQELEHGRARMSNSVGGVNKAGVKWKIRERKK